EINPHFIRLRSLRVPSRVPLFNKVRSGEFEAQSDEMLVEEIKLFIESLEGITSTVTSDHIMNLLEDVSGTLPQDKIRMLNSISDYCSLAPVERLIYRTGRRAGVYRSPRDLHADPLTYQKISALLEGIIKKQGLAGVEDFISELADRYI
ncbi:MAG: radical SAM protein, partial [Desulfobacteraceae bacterium]